MVSLELSSRPRFGGDAVAHQESHRIVRHLENEPDFVPQRRNLAGVEFVLLGQVVQLQLLLAEIAHGLPFGFALLLLARGQFLALFVHVLPDRFAVLLERLQDGLFVGVVHLELVAVELQRVEFVLEGFQRIIQRILQDPLGRQNARLDLADERRVLRVRLLQVPLLPLALGNFQLQLLVLLDQRGRLIVLDALIPHRRKVRLQLDRLLHKLGVRSPDRRQLLLQFLLLFAQLLVLALQLGHLVGHFVDVLLDITHLNLAILDLALLLIHSNRQFLIFGGASRGALDRVVPDHVHVEQVV
uniref:(northern house mosquito) hypothetical protein n=1 Tax=Culex pipiens TaxID=7175 RepID=A0A8D8C6D3_CULPI